jgi:hypothetical protein
LEIAANLFVFVSFFYAASQPKMVGKESACFDLENRGFFLSLLHENLIPNFFNMPRYFLP